MAIFIVGLITGIILTISLLFFMMWLIDPKNKEDEQIHW